MRARARAVSDEIPTSSMADIAFLLIVYFLITMAFTVTRGLDFALPHDRDEPREIQRVESVLIEVLPTGKLLVDSRSQPIEELLDYLRPRLLQDPGAQDQGAQHLVPRAGQRCFQ
jgi:biopolymer transport protein ExbD